MANNRIQIKRSATTATPSALLPGELAFSNVTGGSGVLFIGDTSNTSVVAIGGVRNPGVLTANQALVANSTKAIDQVVLGNLEFTGTTQTLTVNGSPGTAGFVLFSGGPNSNAYWTGTGSITVNTAFAYSWSNVHTWFSNAQINSSAWAWVGNTTTSPTVSIANNGAITVGNGTTTQTNSFISIANSTGNVQITPGTTSILATGTVNALSFSTGVTGTGTGGSVQNATTIFVGNNSINTLVTSAGLNVNGSATIANNTGVYTGIVNATSHNSGALGTGSGGFSANTTTVLVGNNTINTNISAANVLVQNATGIVVLNPTSLTIGNSSTTTVPSVALGNSTVNTLANNSTLTVVSATTNSQLTSSSLFVGNTTVNSVSNSSTFQITGNTTTLATAALSSSGLLIGNGSVTSTGLVLTLANSVVNTQITPALVSVSNSTSNAQITPALISVGNSTYSNTRITSTGIRLGNTTVNTQIEPFGGSILQNWQTNTSVFNQAQFGGLDSYTTVSLSQTTGSNTTTVNSVANDISSSIYSAFYGTGAFGGRAIYGTNSSSGFIGLWSNTTAIQAAPAFTDYTINGLRANSTALIFGNSTVNSTSNSSTFQVTGNTTTLATAALSSSGLALGNSTVTSTSLVVSVANTLGNVQITPISMRVANSTAATFIANATQITIGANAQLSANGGVGSAGQVLASNGATGSPYWTTAITGVTAGNGLTGGGSSGTVTLDAGAGNGISVSADAIAVFANVSSGLIANATGLHIKTGAGVIFDGNGNVAINTASLSFQDLTVSGNLTVLGDLVSLNVATLSVEDSIITLAKDQGSTATYTDAVDIGFFGTYGNTANAFVSGLFRDQSDSGIWKLFTSNGTYTNAIINTANTDAFKLATLQSYLTSGAQFISNATSVYVTANSTVNVNISANVLSLSGRANNDLLFTNGTGGVTGLALGISGYVVQSNGTAIVYDWLDGGTF